MNYCKDVPLPRNMVALPRDSRGLPVPFVVMRDPQGVPVFTVNDSDKVHESTVKKLCGICGQKLRDDVWVIGGPQSAFHPHGAYIDGPVHHSCGAFALRVCPHLALSSYRMMPDARVERMAQRFAGTTTILVDPTADPLRPQFFVFGRVRGWNRNANGHVIVERPFTQVEYWTNGAQRALAEVRAAFIGEWPDYFPCR